MFAENLAPFFDVEGFAEAVTIDGASGVAIFDNAFLEAAGVYGTEPQALIITADFPSVARGQAFVARSTNYTIQGIEPDGTGVTLLRLSRD